MWFLGIYTISEAEYKSIKFKEAGVYFDCHMCNFVKEMHFLQEENLEDWPQSLDESNEETSTDFNDFEDFF